MDLVVAILSGFVLALGAPWAARLWPRAAGWLLAALPAALAIYFAAQLPTIATGATRIVGYDWAPVLGVRLSFHLDGLGALFALLISGIGALVLVHAGGYVEEPVRRGRCLAYLLLFMGSMLGLVLADNVLTLFVFWELTSISSFLLIGLEHEREPARRSAWQALMVTVAGGQALLVGLLLLALAGGSFELTELLARGDLIREHALYPAILVLILLGAFTKSAQVPFHFWLPNAMEAPAPVSAYLHSATMVKAGVYLLARLTPALGGTPGWMLAVTVVGGVTMLVGAVLALGERDLKRILAYSTVAALGTLVLLLGLGTSAALVAAVVFLLVHALYKGALFLVSGGIDHETGTRDAEALGGLRRALPITAAAALLAALSMAGLPFLFGFIGKELIYHAALEAPLAPALVGAVAVLGFSFMVAVAVLAGARPFLGRAVPTARTPHEPPAALWLGPAVLGIAGLLMGVLPRLVEAGLVMPAAAGIAGRPVDVGLHVWPGLQPELALSALSLAAGAGLYAARHRIRSALGALAPERWGPDRGYGAVEAATLALARLQTRTLQSGYLRFYMVTVFAVATAMVGYTLLARAAPPALPDALDIRSYEAGVAIFVLLAAVLAVASTSLLRAVVALGAVGFGIALLFVLFGAPDLAMTQFLVETLTVILFVLVFHRRPRLATTVGRAGRVRDAIVAAAAGAVMALFVLVATRVNLHPSISHEYATRSLPEAHGRNVVNIILVDFRALDTLGEVIVLAVAAVGVFALLKLIPRREEEP